MCLMCTLVFVHIGVFFLTTHSLRFLVQQNTMSWFSHSYTRTRGSRSTSFMLVCLQGNCPEGSAKSSKIPAVQTAQLKPGQCVLVTSTSTLHVATKFWLDNIYIMQRPGKLALQKGFVPAMIIVSGGGKLWATDVTVDGDRVGSQEGLRVEKGAEAFLDGVFSC